MSRVIDIKAELYDLEMEANRLKAEFEQRIKPMQIKAQSLQSELAKLSTEPKETKEPESK